MAFTYSGNPASSSLNKVRFLSGDTDSTNAICQDAEITFLLDEWDNDAYYAAAGVCDYGANKAAAKADYSRSVGNLSLTTMFAAQAQAFQARASLLRNQATFHVGSPKPTASPDALGNFEFSIDMDNNYGY